jgi:hypothetical protein
LNNPNEIAREIQILMHVHMQMCANSSPKSKESSKN